MRPIRANIALLLAWILLSAGCSPCPLEPSAAATGGVVRPQSEVEFTFRVDLDALLGRPASAPQLSVMDSTVAVMKRRLEAMNLGGAELRILGKDTIRVVLTNVPKANHQPILDVLLPSAELGFLLVDERSDFFATVAKELAGFKEANPAEAEGLELVGEPIGRPNDQGSPAESAPEMNAEHQVRYSATDSMSGPTQLLGPTRQVLVRFAQELARLGRIPSDHLIGFEEVQIIQGADLGTKLPARWQAHYILTQPGLTGGDLAQAEVQSDNFGFPTVRLTFTQRGADEFAKLTGEHVDEKLAIMMDGVVFSAPVIKEAIAGGVAVITLAQNRPQQQVMEEATRIQKLLSSGAYAAPVTLVGTSD